MCSPREYWKVMNKEEHLYQMGNPFQSIAFYIENNNLICGENQMAGIYMKFNTGLKWVKLKG